MELCRNEGRDLHRGEVEQRRRAGGSRDRGSRTTWCKGHLRLQAGLLVVLAHLVALLAAAVLPPLGEAGVEVCPDGLVVEACAVEGLYCVQGVSACSVDNERKAARLEGSLVDADDHSLDRPASGEEFEYLGLFCLCVDVPDVEGGAAFEGTLVLFLARVVASVKVAACGSLYALVQFSSHSLILLLLLLFYLILGS